MAMDGEGMDQNSFNRQLRRPGMTSSHSSHSRDKKSPTKPAALSVVVLGASGDLAKKKTFPALFALFSQGYLPDKLNIIGYARSDLTAEALRDKAKKYLKGNHSKLDAFLSKMSYCKGSYTEAEGFQALEKSLREVEEGSLAGQAVARLYYLALPPSAYSSVVAGLKLHCDLQDPPPKSWLRIVVEKPFGKDLESSEQLSNDIKEHWPEEQIFRIDHYLGKELAQNLIVLRFKNTMIAPSYNRHYVDNVQICFKEPFGTEGRGGYFDEFGIIRDVMQNHLTQVLALVAMEKPVSLSADDIRDEKVKVLRCVEPIDIKDTVLGQYTSGKGMPGYLDDEGVPKDSTTATFASCVLHIKNDRWNGVPFILKAGKALNERKVEVRVQFKPPVPYPCSTESLDTMRNELVMRLQPSEAIYLKLAVKKPGLENVPIMSELDLTYQVRYQDEVIPEAYERLILDAINGDQQHFVRSDELSAAWKIFTPLLHRLDEKRDKPIPYVAGSRGPPQADELVEKYGFVKNQEYNWGSNIELSRASMDFSRAAL